MKGEEQGRGKSNKYCFLKAIIGRGPPKLVQKTRAKDLEIV
jgi:hypothetical protein